MPIILNINFAFPWLFLAAQIDRLLLLGDKMASSFGTPANSTLYVKNLPREVPIQEIEELFGKDRRHVGTFSSEAEEIILFFVLHRFSGFVRLRKIRGTMAFVDYLNIDNASRCPAHYLHERIFLYLL
jgi:hypothetical protein